MSNYESSSERTWNVSQKFYFLFLLLEITLVVPGAGSTCRSQSIFLMSISFRLNVDKPHGEMKLQIQDFQTETISAAAGAMPIKPVQPDKAAKRAG